MKNTAVSLALVNLQRKTGVIIDRRHEADARAVLGEIYDSGHMAGVATVPAADPSADKLSADEVAGLRALARANAKPTAKRK